MRKKYRNLKIELAHYKSRLESSVETIEKGYLKIAVRHIESQIKSMKTNYYIQE